MKLVVFVRSSKPPYNFWWSGVADGHWAIRSGWCLLHLWRTCSVVWSSSPQDHVGEGTIFSFLCMCALSMLWPKRSRAKTTWPGMSRKWYASLLVDGCSSCCRCLAAALSKERLRESTLTENYLVLPGQVLQPEAKAVVTPTENLESWSQRYLAIRRSLTDHSTMHKPQLLHDYWVRDYTVPWLTDLYISFSTNKLYTPDSPQSKQNFTSYDKVPVCNPA